MSRFKYLFFAILLVCSHAVAQAQTLKVGLVDFQRALNEVEEGKRAKAALQGQFEQKKVALTAQQDKIKQLKDQLEGQRAALSADVMKQKEAEFRDKIMALQKTVSDYQNEIATKEADLTKSILNKLLVVVRNVGAKDGYSLIFEKSQNALLYAPNAEDITTKVISAFNSGASAAK